MTEREALPYEDLGAWFTDDLLPGWARYWNETPVVPPKPPWYRNSRVLLTVITAAASVLVVATALLLTLSSGDFNQTTLLRSVNPPTSPAATAAPEVDNAPPAPAVASETESEPPPAEVPVASAEQDPPPRPQRSAGAGSSEGPSINVTRAPMSFTPGQPFTP
jgi:hypothetical protein